MKTIPACLFTAIMLSFSGASFAQGQADIKEMQKFTKRFLGQATFYLDARKTAKAGHDDYEAVVVLYEMASRYADLSEFHREEYLIIDSVENDSCKKNIERVAAFRIQSTLQTFELAFPMLDHFLGNQNLKPVILIQAGALKRDLQQFQESLRAMSQKLPKPEAPVTEQKTSSPEPKSTGKAQEQP